MVNTVHQAVLRSQEAAYGPRYVGEHDYFTVEFDGEAYPCQESPGGRYTVERPWEWTAKKERFRAPYTPEFLERVAGQTHPSYLKGTGSSDDVAVFIVLAHPRPIPESETQWP
jgi:hypothetical protein